MIEETNGTAPPPLPSDPAQSSLFDMAKVTVLSHEEHLRAAQVAAGNTVEGRRQVFESRTIRRITLAYGLEEARAVAAWFKVVMQATNCTNPSEVILKVKAAWEKKHGPVT